MLIIGFVVLMKVDELVLSNMNDSFPFYKIYGQVAKMAMQRIANPPYVGSTPILVLTRLESNDKKCYNLLS